MLNVTRKADRIRNDLAVSPVSITSIIANRQSLCVVQFALSFALFMKDLQQVYAVIRETLREFMQREIDESEGKSFCRRIIKGKLVDGTSREIS